MIKLMEETNMRTWKTPEITELDINETAHNWTGIYRDGGYIGDGVISGHLSWDKPEGDGNNSGDNAGDNNDNPANSLS